MGGACSDPSLQFRNRAVLFEDVKNSVVPSMITSPGLVSGYAFGAPTSYEVEEVKTVRVEEIPGTSTVTTLVSQPLADVPVYINPTEDLILNNNLSQVDNSGKMFLESQRSKVSMKALQIQNEFYQMNNNFLPPTIVTPPPAIIDQTSVIQPRTSVTFITTQPQITVTQPQPQPQIAVPQAPGLPFEGNLVASKIDIYGHRVWQDGNVIVQTNNGAQAYQQLDIYGNRRRDFVFQT